MGCTKAKRELRPEQAITQLLKGLLLGILNQESKTHFRLSFRRNSLCLHQRGQKIGTMSATRQMPASSPVGIFPSCPTTFYSCPTVQQDCPCRAVPVHSPVQSQPEQSPGGLGGCSSVGKGKAQNEATVPSCEAFISNWWLCGHTKAELAAPEAQLHQTKIKANSLPLAPRRTEIILSHHQPPQGSSCSPPDSPAGLPGLQWEL